MEWKVVGKLLVQYEVICVSAPYYQYLGRALGSNDQRSRDHDRDPLLTI